MIIGCDIDGVLTSVSVRINFKLPWWLFSGLIFIRPNKKVVEILKKERDIIIVSARPQKLEGLTKKWLRFHGIPFHNLFCVGNGKGIGQRKLEIINRMGIEKFIDDDKGIVDFLLQSSVNAHLAQELFQ
jgi:uncharacterized HAD superfamily protein